MLAQARLLFVLCSLRWGLIPTSEKQLVFSFQSTVATQLRFSGGNIQLLSQPDNRAVPRIEPGTSRIRRENHATRSNSQLHKEARSNVFFARLVFRGKRACLL